MQHNWTEIPAWRIGAIRPNPLNSQALHQVLGQIDTPLFHAYAFLPIMDVDCAEYQSCGMDAANPPSPLRNLLDDFCLFGGSDDPSQGQNCAGGNVQPHQIVNAEEWWSSDTALDWPSEPSNSDHPNAYTNGQMDWLNTGMEASELPPAATPLDEPENWPTPKMHSQNLHDFNMLDFRDSYQENHLQAPQEPSQTVSSFWTDFKGSSLLPDLSQSPSLRMMLKNLDKEREENDDASSSCLSLSEFEGGSEVSSTSSSYLSLSEVEGSSVSSNLTRRCSECQQLFKRTSDMEQHARETRHKPFFCGYVLCTARFSRRDALTRHRDLHGPTRRYPCTECDKYKGADAFKRRDHLLQHMRKAHRVSGDALLPRFCSHSSCTYSGSDGRFWGFRTRKEYTWHMRDVHGQGTFACTEAGCDRTGKKGFARRRDLEMHRRKLHQTQD